MNFFSNGTVLKNKDGEVIKIDDISVRGLNFKSLSKQNFLDRERSQNRFLGNYTGNLILDFICNKEIEGNQKTIFQWKGKNFRVWESKSFNSILGDFFKTKAYEDDFTNDISCYDVNYKETGNIPISEGTEKFSTQARILSIKPETQIMYPAEQKTAKGDTLFTFEYNEETETMRTNDILKSGNKTWVIKEIENMDEKNFFLIAICSITTL